MDEKILGKFSRAFNASEDYVGNYIWRNCDGTITTAGGELAAAQHLKATAEALTATEWVYVDIVPGTVSIELRFRAGSAAADESNVFELYGIAGDDWYSQLATLTCLVGTAVGPDSTLFHDGITITNESNLSTIGTSITGANANNSIARLALNVHGLTGLYICASTLANSPTIYVDYRRF